MSDHDFGDDLATGVHARIGSRMSDESVRHPVEDLARQAVPGEPPVEGAQWDELHGRWERWDDDSNEWVVVGDDPGDAVAPADENPLPSHLARLTLEADDLDPAPAPAAAGRSPEPDSGPAGAQWNEIASRWERWDDASNTWVEATEANEPPPTP